LIAADEGVDGQDSRLGRVAWGGGWFAGGHWLVCMAEGGGQSIGGW
jgi:hypothetical protein